MADEKQYKYRDPKTLTAWALGLQGLWCLISLTNSVLFWSQSELLLKMQRGEFSSREEMMAAANLHDTIVQSGVWSGQAVLIVGTIVFLFWVYRTSANVWAFGARDLYTFPGLSAGCYFIPVYSLWAPPTTMSQVWKASADAQGWESGRGTPVVAIWWTLMLLAGMGGLLLMFVESLRSGQPSTMDGLINQSYLSMAVCALSAAVRLPLIYLIHGISKRQIAQYARRAAAAEASPS